MILISPVILSHHCYYPHHLVHQSLSQWSSTLSPSFDPLFPPHLLSLNHPPSILSSITLVYIFKPQFFPWKTKPDLLHKMLRGWVCKAKSEISSFKPRNGPSFTFGKFVELSSIHTFLKFPRHNGEGTIDTEMMSMKLPLFRSSVHEIFLGKEELKRKWKVGHEKRGAKISSIFISIITVFTTLFPSSYKLSPTYLTKP